MLAPSAGGWAFSWTFFLATAQEGDQRNGQAALVKYVHTVCGNTAIRGTCCGRKFTHQISEILPDCYPNTCPAVLIAGQSHVSIWVIVGLSGENGQFGRKKDGPVSRPDRAAVTSFREGMQKVFPAVTPRVQELAVAK
jgi:hypothetical protein